MLNVTDQCFISPATSKGGFSFNLGDLSRKCYLCHGSCNSRKAFSPLVTRQSGTWSIKLLNPIKWNLLQLAQWRCPKIILKLGNHIYLENFVIVLIKLENLASIPWKVFLFKTDLKRKLNIKDEIRSCKWVKKDTCHAKSRIYGK